MTHQDPTTATLDANLFNIVAPIRISYSSTSINGIPRVSYKDAKYDLSFEGDQITRMKTPLGDLVTVTLENTPDAFDRTFTLIAPAIKLIEGDRVKFDTLGIETTDRALAFVPPPGPAGVLQVNRAYQLHGTAQHIRP
jgi:hypothetical protein